MEKKFCKNGHFYDGDSFSECPHCAAGMKPAAPSCFSMENRMAQEEGGKDKPEGKRKFFGRRKDQSTGNPDRMTAALDLRNRAQKGEVDLISQDKEAYVFSAAQGFGGVYPVEAAEKNRPPTQEKMGEESSVREKTRIQDEGHTIGFFSGNGATDPPVGYLICTEGEDYGTGFLLKSGNNAIGRSASMDVVVMDPKVSREKQAYVMYEPHKREFFLKPGDSSGLCYLNGELVLEPKKFRAYDMISLGETKLMLVPVCGENFSW